MTNNFAFCISQYFLNRYNFQIDESICFVLGSSIDLSLCSKYQDGTHFDLYDNLPDLEDLYIECNNHLALENLSTVMNCVLRFDSDNNFNDLKWIISDYHNLNKISTLVVISSKAIGHLNGGILYGNVIPLESEPDDYNRLTLEQAKIEFTFSSEHALTFSGKEFRDFWMVPGDDRFNAYRYVVIPPIYKNFNNSVPGLIVQALTRQYLYLRQEQKLVGPKMLLKLYEDLKNNPSEENKNKHKNLLLYSIERHKGLAGLDMNRAYIANVFRTLNEKCLLEAKTLISAFDESSSQWLKVKSLLDRQSFHVEELISSYMDLCNKESAIIYELSKYIL